MHKANEHFRSRCFHQGCPSQPVADDGCCSLETPSPPLLPRVSPELRLSSGQPCLPLWSSLLRKHPRSPAKAPGQFPRVISCQGYFIGCFLHPTKFPCGCSDVIQRKSTLEKTHIDLTGDNVHCSFLLFTGNPYSNPYWSQMFAEPVTLSSKTAFVISQTSYKPSSGSQEAPKVRQCFQGSKIRAVFPLRWTGNLDLKWWFLNPLLLACGLQLLRFH